MKLKLKKKKKPREKKKVLLLPVRMFPWRLLYFSKLFPFYTEHISPPQPQINIFLS